VPPVFVVLWSSAFIAAAIGTGAAPPLLLTGSRFAAAGLVLTLLALVTRARWPRGRRLGHVVVSGLLMQALQFGALYTAIGMGLPGGMVALVQGLNPALIALFAVPVLGERVSVRQWWGFGLGALGVVVGVADRWTHSPGAVLLAVLGLIGLSGGSVYQKRFVRDMDVLSGTAVQFLAGVPPLAVATLVFEHPVVHDPGAFGASLTWIVLVNSVGTFVLLNRLLRRGAASRVGTLFFLIPAVTALMSWLVSRTTLSGPELAGLALGGIGVLLAATGTRPRGDLSGAAPSAAPSASSPRAVAGPSAARRSASPAR
jgi:drug/metabolite transporter (DMT)-like permease